jgi:hypothetical protein
MARLSGTFIRQAGRFMLTRLQKNGSTVFTAVVRVSSTRSVQLVFFAKTL